jgi:hypothetical protein
VSNEVKALQGLTGPGYLYLGLTGLNINVKWVNGRAGVKYSTILYAKSGAQIQPSWTRAQEEVERSEKLKSQFV